MNIVSVRWFGLVEILFQSTLGVNKRVSAKHMVFVILA
jgi:hypothetical protein